MLQDLDESEPNPFGYQWWDWWLFSGIWFSSPKRWSSELFDPSLSGTVTLLQTVDYKVHLWQELHCDIRALNQLLKAEMRAILSVWIYQITFFLSFLTLVSSNVFTFIKLTRDSCPYELVALFLVLYSMFCRIYECKTRFCSLSIIMAYINCKKKVQIKMLVLNPQLLKLCESHFMFMLIMHRSDYGQLSLLVFLHYWWWDYKEHFVCFK